MSGFCYSKAIKGTKMTIHFFNGFCIEVCAGVADVYRRVIGGWEWVAEFGDFKSAIEFVSNS